MIYTALILLIPACSCILHSFQAATVDVSAQHVAANPWLFKYPPYFLPSNPSPPHVQGAKYHPDIYGKLLTEKPDHFPDKKPPSKTFFSSDEVDTANDITNNHFNNEDAGDDDDLYRKKKSFSWVKYGEDTTTEKEASHHQNAHHLDSPEHYIRNEIPITSYKLLTEPEETDQKEKNNMKEQEHVDGEQIRYDDNIEAVYDKALPYLDKWFLHAPNYRMFNQFLHRNGIKNNIFKTHKKSENSNREPKYFEFNDQPRFNHLETIKESNLRQRRPARKFTPNTSKELKSRKNNASDNSLQRQEFQLQPVFTPSQQIRFDNWRPVVQIRT